jgi:signal transduction histidine kinase
MIKTFLLFPLTLNHLLKKFVLLINPRILLIIMATAIFLVETLVMFILNEMPPISRGLEAILDSTILLLLLTPFYLYIYRPFWDERQRKERQIRYLSQQLLIATEAESKRIAHEIHDQCGQTLTALQFGLQTLKKQIPAKDASSLAQTDKLVQVGLIAALTWQIETFQKNFPGINITARLIRKSDLAGKFSSNVEDAIFRICQEALTNIARHASATVVLLYLTLEGRRMELKIEDNGVGFELDRCLEQEDGKCGFGLLGMRERALMGEGRFNISTAPGQGTSILASFPLTEEQTQ